MAHLKSNKSAYLFMSLRLHNASYFELSELRFFNRSELIVFPV